MRSTPIDEFRRQAVGRSVVRIRKTTNRKQCGNLKDTRLHGHQLLEFGKFPQIGELPYFIGKN